MINKKLIKKWIKVLRSRKYKQGTGALRTHGPTECSVDRFCCLGVLCDIIDPAGWESTRYFKNYIVEYNSQEDCSESYLPPDYLKKIGLTRNEEEQLIGMNDNGKKFHEIANYLEKKYL
jgi:hypothetical protein